MEQSTTMEVVSRNEIIEIITPEIADEYLKYNWDNREIRWPRVYEFANDMKTGKWRYNGETIKFAISGRLLDGQHRLLACKEAKVPFKVLVVRNIEDEVFSTIDQGQTRSKSCVFKLADIPNSNVVSGAINRYLTMGIYRITSLDAARKNTRNGKHTHSTGDCLEEYNKRPEYWQNLCNYAERMYRRFGLVKQIEIMAIASHLNLRCHYDLSYVLDFFIQVCFEEHTKMGVIRLLRQRLIKNAQAHSKLDSQIRTQLIRKTWDCYKAGTNPSVLRWTKGVEDEKPFE